MSLSRIFGSVYTGIHLALGDSYFAHPHANVLEYCSQYSGHLYSATGVAHQNAAFAHLIDEGNSR